MTGKLSLKNLSGAPVIHIFLWIFLVANLVSLVMINEIFAGLRYMMITVYLIALTYFLKIFVTDYRAMRLVVTGYLISAFFSIFLIGLGYLGMGQDLFIRYGTRAQGLFKDTNVFGPFLIFPILYLINEIIHPHTIRGHLLAKLVGISALIAGVFLSGSRAAWGNLLLSLCLYFVLIFMTMAKGEIHRLLIRLKANYKILLLFMGLLIIAGVIIQPGNSAFIKDFLAERAQYQVYDMQRFGRQAEGLRMGLTNLFGVGPGRLADAHSLYIRTLAEHGIFGFISLMLFILYLLMATLRLSLRETGKRYGLTAKVLFATLAGQLLNSAVIDSIHWRHFWFLLALAWVVITLPANTERPSPFEREGHP